MGDIKIFKQSDLILDVVFYSYLEPENGYFIQYDSEGAIEVEHLDDIKKEAPVLYREIKDLIDEKLMELEVMGQ